MSIGNGQTASPPASQGAEATGGVGSSQAGFRFSESPDAMIQAIGIDLSQRVFRRLLSERRGATTRSLAAALAIALAAVTPVLVVKFSAVSMKTPDASFLAEVTGLILALIVATGFICWQILQRRKVAILEDVLAELDLALGVDEHPPPRWERHLGPLESTQSARSNPARST